MNRKNKTDISELDGLMDYVRERHPGEKEFHAAVQDLSADVLPYIQESGRKEYLDPLKQLLEPDRSISFRVSWRDDKGKIRVNRGYRIQYCNALGPYKGGLRFHPTVNQGIFKFLGFEQTFKNSLTGLSLGGAKGGADFNPKGLTDAEVERFCVAFMTELSRYIGADTDVPAGDIGVGSREIAFLFASYKRITGKFAGVVTGKQPIFGGSCVRDEATGYGCVYLAEQVLKHHGDSLDGRTCLVSGAGNVALHTAEKLLQKNARVLSLSDSSGSLYMEDGLTGDLLENIESHKTEGRSLQQYAKANDLDFGRDRTPWSQKAELVFPCATQNELNEKDAETLIDSGCRYVFEGANMPCTSDAIAAFRQAGVPLVPGKAANAGGVAVSGLEMSQNSMRMSWNSERVDQELRDIMMNIHELCVSHGETDGGINYKKGANIAGFIKVAEALKSYGLG